MARALRLEVAGGWYHVLNRGIERRKLFTCREDYQRFLAVLAMMPERFRLRIHAFVLMPNHYHLQIETELANLSQALHWLNVTYSVWFNRRHRRIGTLFQGRFKALLHEPESRGLIINRYIHLNPVKIRRFGTHRGGSSLAEAVGEDPRNRDRLLEELGNYRWSSYGSYSGKVKIPWLTTETILSSLGDREIKQNQMQYVRGIEELIGSDQFETGWKKEVVGQLFLGSLRFVQDMKKRLKEMNRNEQAAARELGYENRDWSTIVKAVERVWKQPWESFCDRHGDYGRDLAMLLARERTGMRLNEIGQEAGGLKYPAVAAAIRLARIRLQQDETLARKYRRLCRLLFLGASGLSRAVVESPKLQGAVDSNKGGESVDAEPTVSN